MVVGFILSLMMANGYAANNSRPLYEMSRAEINQLLARLKKKPFLERFKLISSLAKGTPYFLGPLGEGENSPFDKKPLIDLKRVDCVTYCEQTLALALSNDYKEMFDKLQKIRYKDGQIRMQKRNHYFMVDWLRNNQWLVKDVTAIVGQSHTKSRTQTISHKSLFSKLKYKNLKAEEPDRTVTISYVPKHKLHLISDKMKTGDIAVFIQNYSGIFASHTGFIVKTNQGIFFRNATSIGPKQVVDLPFTDLVSYLKKSKRNLGLAFLRPNEDLLK